MTNQAPANTTSAAGREKQVEAKPSGPDPPRQAGRCCQRRDSVQTAGRKGRNTEPRPRTQKSRIIAASTSGEIKLEGSLLSHHLRNTFSEGICISSWWKAVRVPVRSRARGAGLSMGGTDRQTDSQSPRVFGHARAKSVSFEKRCSLLDSRLR